MKYYQVIFVDEYNNFYELGFFKSLAEAEPLINECLDTYSMIDDDGNPLEDVKPEFGEGKNLGRLEEYPSTLNYCFDRTIDVDVGCVQVRGFINETEAAIEHLKNLESGGPTE